MQLAAHLALLTIPQKKLPQLFENLSDNQTAKNAAGVTLGIAAFLANWVFANGALLNSERKIVEFFKSGYCQKLSLLILAALAAGSASMDAAFPFDAKEEIVKNFGVENEDAANVLYYFCCAQAIATAPTMIAICSRSWIKLTAIILASPTWLKEKYQNPDMSCNKFSSMILAGSFLAIAGTRLYAFYSMSQDIYRDDTNWSKDMISAAGVIALLGEGPLSALSMAAFSEFVDPYIKFGIKGLFKIPRSIFGYQRHIDEPNNGRQIVNDNESSMEWDEKSQLIFDIIVLSLNAIGNGMLILRKGFSISNFCTFIAAITSSLALCSMDVIEDLKKKLEFINFVTGNKQHFDYNQTLGDYLEEKLPTTDNQVVQTSNIDIELGPKPSLEPSNRSRKSKVEASIASNTGKSLTSGSDSHAL